MNSVVNANPGICTEGRDALCRLPVFRPVAIQLMSLLTKLEPDILEVAELLRSDPGFLAEILTASNSAAFGPSNRVNTVHKAILVLGTERTRKLVVRAALQGMVRGMKQDATIQNCWIHSRASAALAAWLAPYYQIHPDRAYTVALMHDVGRLGLLSVHGSRYAELLERVSGTNENILDAERISLSVDHCEAGEWLTKTWGLPAEFQESTNTHHRPVEGAMRDPNDLVACACAMAQALGFGAALQVESEPIESLLNRVPAGTERPTHYSTNDLAHFVCKELQV